MTKGHCFLKRLKCIGAAAAVAAALRPAVAKAVPVVLDVMQELSEWACIYIRYLQIFRKLETAYDQMLQPQTRQDMTKALEACMGRMLEIRHWMVRAELTLRISSSKCWWSASARLYS